MRGEYKGGELIFFLEGRIDSNNADKIEKDIMDEGSLLEGMNVVFDAAQLKSISSAGLRVLLKVKRTVKKQIRVINVSDEVFDVFEVTGFIDMFEVERMIRTVSIRGCRKISSALNGEIFQLSDDEIVKVYGKDIPLSDIKKERNYSQTALICGVPTLIPYDVVQCERGYGIVYEKAEMTSLAYLISHDPASLERYALMLAKTLKELHATEIPEGKLPDIKDRYRQWIRELGDPEDNLTAVFSNLISSIPGSNMYVHGDINLNSVMVKGGELLLLDMSGSARGNSIFDLQSLFASLIGIESKHEGYCLKTYNLSKASCLRFWNAFFKKYMTDRNQEIDNMNQLLMKYSVLKENILLKLEQKNRYKQAD